MLKNIFKNFRVLTNPIENLPTEKLNLFQSINQALDQFMNENPNSFIFGEDVKFGGVF